jgi:hypothetical protein
VGLLFASQPLIINQIVLAFKSFLKELVVENFCPGQGLRAFEPGLAQISVHVLLPYLCNESLENIRIKQNASNHQVFSRPVDQLV